MKRCFLFVTALLVVMSTQAGTAGAQTFGAWTANTTGREFLYAINLNESGHALGQWCYLSQGSCVWLLGIRTACERGERYPVLVNADTGSASLEIQCDGPLANLPGVYRYVFTDFDRITNAVMGSTRVGFAMPLKGDEFRVFRFDLNGAPSAIRSMRSAAAQRVQPGRRGTLDEKL